jgi:hypothetical protein
MRRIAAAWPLWRGDLTARGLCCSPPPHTQQPNLLRPSVGSRTVRQVLCPPAPFPFTNLLSLNRPTTAASQIGGMQRLFAFTYRSAQQTSILSIPLSGDWSAPHQRNYRSKPTGAKTGRSACCKVENRRWILVQPRTPAHTRARTQVKTCSRGGNGGGGSSASEVAPCLHSSQPHETGTHGTQGHGCACP